MTRPDGTPATDQVLADGGPAILLVVAAFMLVVLVAAAVSWWRARRTAHPSVAERRLDRIAPPRGTAPVLTGDAPLFTADDFARGEAWLANQRSGGAR